MKCIRSFVDLKEQRQLHYEPACQKDTKEGDKEIQGVTIDLKAISHPAELIVYVCHQNRAVSDYHGIINLSMENSLQ